MYKADGETLTHITHHEASFGEFEYRKSAYIPTTVAFETHHKASILCLQYDEEM